VVWQAGPAAPAALVGEDGSIALRCPLFKPEAAWMAGVLTTLAAPLPTTSVNRGGETPCSSWHEAAELGNSQGFYVPKLSSTTSHAAPPEPSTLIRLSADGGFELLRAGAFDTSSVLKL
jgi:tRNA A37 threonylcarbamoyladenosine synthetase subunit TsaC/SUA5/YrdC